MTTFTRIQVMGDVDLMVYPKNKTFTSAITLMNEYNEMINLKNLTPKKLEDNIHKLVDPIIKKVNKDRDEYRSLPSDAPKNKFDNRVKSMIREVDKLDDIITSNRGILLNTLLKVNEVKVSKDYPIELNLSDSDKVKFNNYFTIEELLNTGITSDLLERTINAIDITEYTKLMKTSDMIASYFEENKYIVNEVNGVVGLIKV